LVPVVPAAHYSVGGIKTNINGETSIKHLYACGECASTGVQGANRLASNSLLEGLVFGARAAAHAVNNRQPEKNISFQGKKEVNLKLNKANREKIKNIMWQNVGIIRDKQNLEIAVKKLNEIETAANDFETDNLLLIAKLVTNAALKRKESRGCHFRSDFPKNRLVWKRHQELKVKL